MRKFLSLLFAMMLMVGSMSATTIYCKVDKSWWKADGAAVAVHHWGGTTAGTTWPGVRMTPVNGEADTWSYDVPADVTGLMFVRVNGSGAVADWGAKTADLTLPTDGKNLYTITSEAAVWGNPGVTGEWSVYGEEPITPPTPAKFYVTGDSALVDSLAWQSNAIKSESDTLVLKLAAGSYTLKVTVDGTWKTAKGYSDLTVKADGLSTDKDNNIHFTLAEAGTVKVIYTNELFKLEGNFYVAPVAPDPTVAVKGSMNAWGDSIPFVLAQDKLSASLTVENIKKGTYEFKMIINGEWRSNGYTYHRDFAGAAGISGNNDANMVLQLDVDGQYTFTWTFANDSLGIIFPEKPANVLENGYYLVGKVVNDWTPAAQYLFAENTETAGEYMLSVNLTQGDSIKVVYVENDAIKTWYPGGDNYAVDANHVGTTTMYFRPNYDGGEGWFARCIFIAPTGTVDVQNVATDTKAVKVLREGQVVIIRGEHIYTIMGQMIK